MPMCAFASSVPRSRAKDLIREAGGTVASSLSANVDYLVVGADPGSKLDKAVALAVPVIDEDALWTMLGRKGGAPGGDQGA